MSTEAANVDLLRGRAEAGGEGVALDAFVGSVGWNAVKAVAGGVGGVGVGGMQRAWTEMER